MNHFGLIAALILFGLLAVWAIALKLAKVKAIWEHKESGAGDSNIGGQGEDYGGHGGFGDSSGSHGGGDGGGHGD